MSGLREAVPIMYILTTGNDYTAEVEAMEAVQSRSDSERDVVRYIVKRLEAVELSSAIYKNYEDHFWVVALGLNGEGWDPTFTALCSSSCAYFKSWGFGEQSSDFCIFWKPFTFKYKCKENEWKTRKTRLGHTSTPEVEDDVFIEGEKTAIATAEAARAVALAKKGTACIKSTFCAKVRPCSSIHCWCFSAMTASCKAWFSVGSIYCCVYWIVKFWIV